MASASEPDDLRRALTGQRLPAAFVDLDAFDANAAALLTRAGFTVMDVPEGHLCCGSAGTYNLMQPDLAGRLKRRKVANIESLAPDAVATGNIGCMAQIGGGTDLPIVHTVALLDWSTGGPLPVGLDRVVDGDGSCEDQPASSAA